ncbi:MAG: hypothetical protein HY023_14715, partial [Chloroflexi bacterium]|nr:hypothetical protein [Chloroflexota bacterium]
MPATLGSRRRAREALQAARAPRPARTQPPDLTFWLTAAGIGTFLVLLLVAGVMLTVGILARNAAASPTAVAVAPTQSSAAAPT